MQRTEPCVGGASLRLGEAALPPEEERPLPPHLLQPLLPCSAVQRRCLRQCATRRASAIWNRVETYEHSAALATHRLCRRTLWHTPSASVTRTLQTGTMSACICSALLRSWDCLVPVLQLILCCQSCVQIITNGGASPMTHMQAPDLTNSRGQGQP